MENNSCYGERMRVITFFTHFAGECVLNLYTHQFICNARTMPLPLYSMQKESTTNEWNENIAMWNMMWHVILGLINIFAQRMGDVRWRFEDSFCVLWLRFSSLDNFVRLNEALEWEREKETGTERGDKKQKETGKKKKKRDQNGKKIEIEFEFQFKFQFKFKFPPDVESQNRILFKVLSDWCFRYQLQNRLLSNIYIPLCHSSDVYAIAPSVNHIWI